MKFKLVPLILALGLIFALISSGCSIEPSDDDGKIKIVTTLFPLYDFAKQITGDKANVSLLLHPGVEAHSYEPTPRDIINLSKADVFIYTGEFMEPWAHKTIETIKNDSIVVIESGKNINLIELTEDHDEDYDEDHDEGHDEEHAHDGTDPHIWLDPLLAVKMLDNILEGIILSDPENEEYYSGNAAGYELKLQKLHEDFVDLVENSRNKTIIHGGHFAFGYFARRYDLSYMSPYSGFAPNSEPTTQKIAQLIDNLNESDTNVIYFEELIEPRVAQVISDQTGARMLILHAAHNISKEELDEGITYLEIMYNNLENLKVGLEYE